MVTWRRTRCHQLSARIQRPTRFCDITSLQSAAVCHRPTTRLYSLSQAHVRSSASNERQPKRRTSDTFLALNCASENVPLSHLSLNINRLAAFFHWHTPRKDITIKTSLTIPAVGHFPAWTLARLRRVRSKYDVAVLLTVFRRRLGHFRTTMMMQKKQCVHEHVKTYAQTRCYSIVF